MNFFDTDESRGFWDTPKKLIFRRAMESRAGNENANQAQRTSINNPEKL
jgi:hypothetical protein